MTIRILALNWRDIKNPEAGGAEIVTHQILKGLVEMGHRTTLICSRFKSCKEVEIIDGVEIIRMGGKYSVYRKARAHYSKCKDRYDIVLDEINTLPFNMITLVEKDRLFTLIHQLAREVWLMEMPFLIGWVGKNIMEDRWLRAYRDIPCLTVSRSTANDLRNLGFSDINIIPEGLNFKPLDRVSEKTSTPTLTFVGRLKRSKLPDHAIRAFEIIRISIPDAHLNIIGDGYMKSHLEDMRISGVEFHGRLPEDKMSEIVRSSHLLLVPGTREGWGLVVTEANALGTPALGYNVSGLRDSIKDGVSGWLCEPTPEDMAAKAILLLRDAETLEKISYNALEDSKQYSWRRTVEASARVMGLLPDEKRQKAPLSTRAAIVTPYPPLNSKHVQTTGVASYSKNLISNLSSRAQIDVLCDSDEVDTGYLEGNVRVVPTWRRGIRYPFKIVREMKKIRAPVVHIQHETFIFGGIGKAMEFPILLVILRLNGIRTVVTMHGVVPLNEIDQSFLELNRINGSPILMKKGLRFLTREIGRFADRIIVHEESLQRHLIDDYKITENKVVVINHGIEAPGMIMDSGSSKKALDLNGKKVILFLGYLTGYKNVDVLIECMRFLPDDHVLIIGGGEHPRMKDDHEYSRYISRLKGRADEISPNRIRFHGFIPENMIPTYMGAADVMAFPYNICMSTSGPLSMAIAYEKPFVVSECFNKIVGIPEAVYNGGPEALAERILNMLDESWDGRAKIIRRIKEMRIERSWENISRKTEDLYLSLGEN